MARKAESIKITNTTNKGSASSRVIEALKDEISAGNLKPGERLDEARLAEKLGVSRTPVREAFKHLVAQQILTSDPGRGVRVVEFSRDELSQVFEVMFEIELTCARLVARRLTFLARSEIEAAQAKCISTANEGDPAAYARANENLHATIYKATGNKYMEELASEFRRRTGPFRARKLRSHEDLIASAKSHDVLLEKIFSADSEIAVAGMRDHMAASFLKVFEGN